MVTHLQHIKYKSFDKKRYELNDTKGKNCITRFLKSIGHTVQEPIETMRMDLESVYKDTTYYHEVEMKHMWSGEWPEIWLDVHIPYRKKKLIDYVIKRIDISYSKISEFIYKIDELSLKKKKPIDLKTIKEII